MFCICVNVGFGCSYRFIHLFGWFSHTSQKKEWVRDRKSEKSLNFDKRRQKKRDKSTKRRIESATICYYFDCYRFSDTQMRFGKVFGSILNCDIVIPRLLSGADIFISPSNDGNTVRLILIIVFSRFTIIWFPFAHTHIHKFCHAYRELK